MDIRRRGLVLASPVAIIALGRGVEVATGPVLGAWAWVPTMLVFWLAIGVLVGWVHRGHIPREWLRKPRGRAVWSAVALLVGVMSLQEFVSGWQALLSPEVATLWLVFGLINPWFEEAYWRGVIIDAAGRWAFAGVLYSAAAFAVSHPLVWGVHSVALRHPAALVGLGLAGLVWALAYWRTGSLRWTVAGHAAANLLGLSVPVLLNLHSPAFLK